MATYNNARFKWVVKSGEAEVMTGKSWPALEADGVAEVKTMLQAFQRHANGIDKDDTTTPLPSDIKIKYSNVNYDPMEEVI